MTTAGRRSTAALVFATVAVSAAGCVDDPPRRESDVASTTTSDASPVTRSEPVLTELPEPLTREARLGVGRVHVEVCGGSGSGSGFFFEAHTMATNRHVVEDATAAWVETPDGDRLEVTKVEVSTVADLARLAVDGTAPTVLSFSETVPSAGDRLRAIGFPRGRDVTATEGRLVATEGGPDERFEISAVVEPGNSGGPVLDDRDQVVGVTTAIELDSGIGLVIPIARLRENRRWVPYELRDPSGCDG